MHRSSHYNIGKIQREVRDHDKARFELFTEH